MKQRIIFLCYGNNMVPLVFNDIGFYNIHSSQKWIILISRNFKTIILCIFRLGAFFLMINASNCKRDNALTSLWIKYFFFTVVLGYLYVSVHRGPQMREIDALWEWHLHFIFILILSFSCLGHPLLTAFADGFTLLNMSIFKSKLERTE